MNLTDNFEDHHHLHHHHPHSLNSSSSHSISLGMEDEAAVRASVSNNYHHHDMIRMDHYSMKMTFGNIWDYKVILFFDSWNITTPELYFICWLMVCLAVVGTHYIKHLLLLLELEMRSVSISSTSTIKENQIISLPRRRSLFFLIHSLLSTINYAVINFIPPFITYF